MIDAAHHEKLGGIGESVELSRSLASDVILDCEINPPGRMILGELYIQSTDILLSNIRAGTSSYCLADAPPTPATCSPSAGDNAGLLIDGLARLPKEVILDEKRLATILGVTPRTVRRMVERHELPPPVSLAGRSTWIVGRVLAHIESAAERAAKKAEREKARLSKYSP